jgi:hypothetical protein
LIIGVSGCAVRGAIAASICAAEIASVGVSGCAVEVLLPLVFVPLKLLVLVLVVVPFEVLLPLVFVPLKLLVLVLVVVPFEVLLPLVFVPLGLLVLVLLVVPFEVLLPLVFVPLGLSSGCAVRVRLPLVYRWIVSVGASSCTVGIASVCTGRRTVNGNNDSPSARGSLEVVSLGVVLAELLAALAAVSALPEPSEALHKFSKLRVAPC